MSSSAASTNINNTAPLLAPMDRRKHAQLFLSSQAAQNQKKNKFIPLSDTDKSKDRMQGGGNANNMKGLEDQAIIKNEANQLQGGNALTQKSKITSSIPIITFTNMNSS